MHAGTPRYVLRNYLVQQAIDRAEQGNAAGYTLEVLRRSSRQPAGPRAVRPTPAGLGAQPGGCSMLSFNSWAGGSNGGAPVAGGVSPVVES